MKPKRQRRLIILAVVISVISATWAVSRLDAGSKHNNTSNSSTNIITQLNPQKFTEWTVTAKDQISPNSYIITVQSPSSITHPTHHTIPFLDKPPGPWSVELRYPGSNIARHYTPLPPIPSTPDSQASRELRFLVRKYHGGEVSTFFCNKNVGETVQLRGPHAGYNVRARLGSGSGLEGKRVLFLAGGTGVAPALQVATYLSSSGGFDGSVEMMPRVDVLWANRTRRDCIGCVAPTRAAAGQSWLSRFWSATGMVPARGEDDEVTTGGTETSTSAVVTQFNNLRLLSKQAKVNLHCVVDEEDTRIEDEDIMRVIRSTTASHPSETTTPSCLHHDSTQQDRIADLSLQDDQKITAEMADCSTCQSHGRNLVIISGPDGFVDAYAGSKRWVRGAERQGELGGVLGRLRDKYPEEWKEWTVLKL